MDEKFTGCPACGAEGCDCIYQCDECDGFHISDWAIKTLGITDQELYHAVSEAKPIEKGE
jgi:hypothetical protein